jgi:hypothetical protein
VTKPRKEDLTTPELLKAAELINDALGKAQGVEGEALGMVVVGVWRTEEGDLLGIPSVMFDGDEDDVPPQAALLAYAANTLLGVVEHLLQPPDPRNN